MKTGRDLHAYFYLEHLRNARPALSRAEIAERVMERYPHTRRELQRFCDPETPPAAERELAADAEIVFDGE